MECPVCLDTIEKPYLLKSCTHVLCVKCYRQLKKVSESFILPTVKKTPIKCPLCRKKEVISLNPTEYIQWLEIELTRDEYGTSYYHETTTKYYKPWQELAHTKPPRHSKRNRSRIYS